MLLREENDPMSAFTYALKAAETKRQYPRRLKVFFDYSKIDGPIEEQAKQFLIMARTDPHWAQDSLIAFIVYQIGRVTRHEIAESTISNYYKATKLFCEMNDLTLSWKKIARGLPQGRKSANDRAPTVGELQKLVEYPDRRIKPIVYTMISSGVRIGFWDTAQWKHVTPIINQQGDVIAAKLVVYPGDREEHYTFITPTAYNCLLEWMNFRASYGETITNESWLMRDLWQTSNMQYGAKFGLATNPKRLKSSAIKRLIERALWEQGIRRPLANGANRHEWKAAHGMRKWYKSRAEQVMKPINVELTMGHIGSLGVSRNYWRPTAQEVLDDYLKAVPLLSVNQDSVELRKQVQELNEKSKDTEYVIKAKLLEKDEIITSMKEKYDSDIEDLKQAISDMQNLLRHPSKLTEISN